MNPEQSEQVMAPSDHTPAQTAGDHDDREDAGHHATTVVVHGEIVAGPQARASATDSPPPQDHKDSPPPGHQATVVVRGETISDKEQASPKGSSPEQKEKPAKKEVSEAKVIMQNSLPALRDDGDVGVQKEHVVTRDGKADLAFVGTLLASAAPLSAAQGQWQEYRIYETNGGKHVFSKVTRSIFAEQRDTYAAEVYDPTPSSVPSKLLRSARDLTHSRPMTWADAAVDFFGYDPLAKALYRKLSGQFEEHIS